MSNRTDSRYIHIRIACLVVLVAGMASPVHADQWQPIGPAPIEGFFPGGDSGRATAIAVNPFNGDQVWIGTAAGGVWYTPNAGDDWFPQTDHEESLAIGALAVADCNTTWCNHVYAGTGENAIRRDTYYGAGLLVGTAQVGPINMSFDIRRGDEDVEFRGGSINDVVLHPGTVGDNQIIFVTLSSGVTVSGTNSTVTAPEPSPGGWGIFRSDDNGVSWTKVNVANAEGERPTDLKMHPSQPSVMYAGFLGRGLFKSTDGGVSWCPLNPGIDGGTACPVSTGLPDVTVATFDHVEVAIFDNDPDVLYATFGHCPDPLIQDCQPSVFKSIDAGETWTEQWEGATDEAAGDPIGCPTVYSRYTHGLTIHPTLQNKVWLAGVRLCLSVTHGDGWIPVDQNLAAGTAPWDWGKIIHLDHHEIVFDPTNPLRVYSTSDGGFARSIDGGHSWRHKNDELQITGFHALASSPDTNNVFGTSQDNGGQMWTGSDAWDWRGCCGDGGFAEIDLDDPMIVYAGSNWGAVRRSVNGGFSWKFKGINGDPRLFYAPFFQDKTPPHPLYWGGAQLWRSTNDGDSWQAVSPVLSNSPQTEITAGADAISAISVAPSNPNRIYIGYYGGGVFRTDNACADVNPPCWTQVDTGLPAGPVTGIAVHKTNPDTVWAAFSGFGDHPRIWKSTNGGDDWVASSTSLPVGTPVNVLVNGLGDSDNLLVGLDSNASLSTIWRSPDGGETWISFSEGLPNAPVHDIEVDAAHSRTLAGTHGRGAWVRGGPLIFPIEDWGDIFWNVALVAGPWPPEEDCTIDMIQQDGTICASSNVDAQGGTLHTDGRGRLVTTLAGQFESKPMAWACFGGSCVGGVEVDLCDMPENPIGSISVTCGKETATQELFGAQMMADPPSAFAGVAFDSGGNGGAIPATATYFDVVASLQASDGSTRSLCTVNVSVAPGEGPDDTWSRAAEKLNENATCTEGGLSAFIEGGEPPTGAEDDFRHGPWLGLSAPGETGTQLITAIHAAPGEAVGDCFQLHHLGLPMLNQGQVIGVQFKTSTAGAAGGGLVVVEQTPLGACEVEVPTFRGQTASEVALAVQSAFGAPGIPGPHGECPASKNPRDVSASGDMVTVAYASRVEICVNDPGLGFLMKPADLGNSHPVAACADRIVECTGTGETGFTLDATMSRDPDSTPGTQNGILSYEWYQDFGTPDQVLLGTGPTLPVSYPTGSAPAISVIVTDVGGLQDGADCHVQVVDTTPPTLTTQIDPTILWPPDHRMVDVGTLVGTSDLCGSVALVLEGADSDEPDDAPGDDDGETVDDVQGAAIGTADKQFMLRAERDRRGEGRTYAVRYRATDDAGNASNATATVHVPLLVDGVVEPILLDMHKVPEGVALSWTPVAHATDYDVIRGVLTSINENGNIHLGDVQCLAQGTHLPNTFDNVDDSETEQGTTFFYLVRSNNDLSSGWGTETARKPRVPAVEVCD